MSVHTGWLTFTAHGDGTRTTEQQGGVTPGAGGRVTEPLTSQEKEITRIFQRYVIIVAQTQ